MKQFTKRRQSKMHLNQFLFTLWEQKYSVFQRLTIKSISEAHSTKYSLQPELKLEQETLLKESRQRGETFVSLHSFDNRSA